MEYYCDDKRHLVCVPYSKENLHIMADELNIKRCWFHKDHYDIPKRRINEISAKCTIINSKEIIKIISECVQIFITANSSWIPNCIPDPVQ